MSATRDKSQKITFVYSNLYQIYRKGKETSKAAPSSASEAPSAPSSDPSLLLDTVSNQPLVVPTGLTSGLILKSAGPKIEDYRPAEFIGKRLAKPHPIVPNPAIQSLKDNLKNLNDLHARLRFMLQELEELTKR